MPITNDNISRRVKKVREAARKQGLEALVVYAAPECLPYSVTLGNVRFLTNWTDRNEGCLLVLPLEADPALLVYGGFNKVWPEHKGTWVKDIRWEVNTGSYGLAARRILQERGIASGRIGIVGRQEMWAPVYEGLTAKPCPWEFEDADDIVAQQRVIKEPEEIELIRMSAKVADSMLSTFMNSARVPGKWAWQLMAEAEYTGRSMGADVASLWMHTGPAPVHLSTQLWHNDRQIQAGDRLAAGTYVSYGGYWSNCIRMGTVGKPSSELVHYFNVLLEAQDAAIRLLKPGNRLRDAVQAMEVHVAENSPYSWEEDPMRARFGHGLGLQHADPVVSEAFPHPPAFLSNRPASELWGRPEMGGGGGETDLLVQPGMAIELHPNFGVPGLGSLWVGDDVLVTESGVELLTLFPREIFEI